MLRRGCAVGQSRLPRDRPPLPTASRGNVTSSSLLLSRPSLVSIFTLITSSSTFSSLVFSVVPTRVNSVCTDVLRALPVPPDNSPSLRPLLPSAGSRLFPPVLHLGCKSFGDISLSWTCTVLSCPLFCPEAALLGHRNTNNNKSGGKEISSVGKKTGTGGCFGTRQWLTAGESRGPCGQ